MHDATHTCSGTPSSPRSSTLTPTYVTSKSPPARPTRPVDLSYVGVVTEQNAADGFVGLIRHRPHWTALRHLSSWLAGTSALWSTPVMCSFSRFSMRTSGHAAIRPERHSAASRPRSTRQMRALVDLELWVHPVQHCTHDRSRGDSR